MKTFFKAEPFTRFELGDYARGRGCPPGTVPMSYGGRIVCEPGSLPSGMWSPYGGGRGVAYGMAGLGQMESPYLEQAERDRLLQEIQGAVKLVKPLDDIISWSVRNDEQLKNTLGTDWTRFFALSNSIAPLYPTVADLGDRLAQTDAEYWYRPKQEELASVKQWITGIQEMYKILQAHPTPAKPLPVGTKPPPSVAPAAVAPAKMPTGGPLTSTGPSTTDYLIGAGVAVGLGALIYTLVG